MEEPSVLDYVKSKIAFWRKEQIQIPTDDFVSQPESKEVKVVQPLYPDSGEIFIGEVEDVPFESWVLFPTHISWKTIRVLLTLGLALLAQRALEPTSRSTTIGIFFYSLAILWLLWSHFKGELVLPGTPPVEKLDDSLSFKPIGLWVCLPLCLLAFFMFGENLFTRTNIILWLLALASFIYAFWYPDQHIQGFWTRIRHVWTRFINKGITLSPWILLVIIGFGISAYYRFYLLDQVPAEMFSDHAEKLLDVRDVLNGQTRIFFPRNTGREAIQMYMTAMMVLIFNTGLSFLSLKLGTAFCGLFTLPFIYLLGVEVANRRVGLFAMIFAGIAYWPNVISRVALRFTLYPTFTAPMLYFLIRGLRRKNRNDFILSGIFLGLGMHGYSPFRFVPFLVVVAVFLYLVHSQSKGARSGTILGFSVLTVVTVIISLPLLRYAISNPAMFGYRMLTRIGEVERPFPEPPVQIFFKNLWAAVIMPFWDNGVIWVHSVPSRPALGIVCAVFLAFGVVLLLVRYMRERNWLDLFLLVSIPLLMMPSVLSLAFPEENPSLNRTGGALVVIFLIVGMAFDSFLSAFKSKSSTPGGNWLAWVVGIVLFIWSATQNYNLVFDKYAQQFRANAWNTSELGAVIRQFAVTSGAEASAWVVPFPHWVDTRLVGIRAGFPERDYALLPEKIIETVEDPRAKLYLVKPEDTETVTLLRDLFPTGVLRLYQSQSLGRDFYMYSVPPKE